MSVYKILESVRNERSTKKKIEILNQHKDNKVLRDVLFDSYNPFSNSYIKKIPNVDQYGNDSLSEFYFDIFKQLSSREISGHAALDLVKESLENLNKEDSEVFKGIILKDQKLGISLKSINKAFEEEFLSEFPVMLAHKFEEKRIKNRKPPYIVQLKCDGWRSITTVVNGVVKMYTRSGKEYFMNLDLELVKELQRMEKEFGCPIMLDGELLVVDDDNKILPRHISSSIVGKAVKGTISDKDSLKIRYIVWDVLKWSEFLDKKSDTLYMERLTFLLNSLKDKYIKNGDYLEVVQTGLVNTLEEIYEMSEKFIQAGEEGVMVKFSDSLWENKRSYEALKIKGQFDCELRVVGYLHGDPNKGLEEGIGSLVCESEDGVIKVNVSSGLSMEQRGYIKDKITNKYVFDPSFPLNKYNGEIISVIYNNRITDKYGNESLFSCRIVEFRFDKDSADSSKNIK